ncbi:MAG: competence/damage-inducible protein A [Maricaulaceae bacterium]
MSEPNRLTVTAAVLLIGDELLSGRTRDANLQAIAQFLALSGVQIREARVVSDDHGAIGEALNALRLRHDYVFTTGGIGPTHDDITADAVAQAFGLALYEHPDALAILEARYAAAGTPFTPARRRMARMPQGATLIDNPATGAPGFQIDNVFVLAGVPGIMRAMLEGLSGRIRSGAPVHTVTVRAQGLREGDLAGELGRIAERATDVSLGSYPWFHGVDDYGVALVARSHDPNQIDAMTARLSELVRAQGGTPIIQ